jgi:tRNA nucleotidyltransferase/poly(A) polymerase
MQTAKLPGELSSSEKKIFALLQEVAEDHGVTVRVAGGWVRDKCLGQQSDDIDVCVDVMSGQEFALKVAERLPGKHSVATVSANVEANKHLESAILKIEGIEVDFAQLRKETYDANSRNPVVEPATAEEDARRRDLTINALFYNLHTEKVEDFVGGLQDLNQRSANTPIDPLSTYLEDPLRIFRAVRFAARFDLRVHPALLGAAKDSRVQDALVHKVSRERIWVELAKMLAGPNFDFGVSLLDSFGLRDLLLVPTEEQMAEAEKLHPTAKWGFGFSGWDMEQNNPYHTETVWGHTLVALGWARKNLPNDGRFIRNLSLVFHDIGKCDVCSQQMKNPNHSQYIQHEISSAVAADVMLRDLKAPNDIRKRVVKLVRYHMRLHLLPEHSEKGVRKVLADIGYEDWRNLVEMSMADSMGKATAELNPKYAKFDEYVQKFVKQTGGRSKVKPPLNGKEVMTLLSLTPGPKVGEVMRAFEEKLLEAPAMNKEEAASWLTATFQ